MVKYAKTRTQLPTQACIWCRYTCRVHARPFLAPGMMSGRSKCIQRAHEYLDTRHRLFTCGSMWLMHPGFLALHDSGHISSPSDHRAGTLANQQRQDQTVREGQINAGHAILRPIRALIQSLLHGVSNNNELKLSGSLCRVMWYAGLIMT